MRIQNNITAQNSHRQYGLNNVNIGKNVEKLSSGYRVNRAADDAAGLAISEKMRTQIRGLNMASRNSQDGISLVQTAEGAMQSSHDIMQRMREIAVQSSNGTNDDAVDRAALDLEFQQLASEIKQIEETVKFNDMAIFGKTFTLQSGANSGDTTLFEVPRIASADGTYTTEWLERAIERFIETKAPDGVYTEEVIDEMIDAYLLDINPAYDLTDPLNRTMALTALNGMGITEGATFDPEAAGVVTWLEANGFVEGGVFEANIATLDDAQIALDVLTESINDLSMARAALGAIQNRLEFKIQNLDNSAENLAAAESRIRDVDMAKMMTEFTKNNILFQASTAMLAQANALPQGVLQLLG